MKHVVLATLLVLAGCAHGPRVLLVLAHPDDETMMGIALARLVDAHARIDAVYVTDGEGGRNVLAPTPPPRIAELLRALGWYHVHLVARLHAPDVALRDAAGKPTRDPAPFLDGRVWPADLRERLSRVVHAHHYDLVLTLVPDGSVVHAHHRAVGRLVQAMHVAPTYGVLERGWYPDDVLGSWDVECRDGRSRTLHGAYRVLAAKGASFHASQDAGHRGLGPDVERYRLLAGDPLAALCR